MTEEQKLRVLLWVEALESGKYKQTRDHLRDERGMCCLGVACEVYRSTTGNGEWTAAEEGDFFARGALAFGIESPGDVCALPHEVVDWFGVESSDPELLDPTPQHRPASYTPHPASFWNDAQEHNFMQIAATVRF